MYLKGVREMEDWVRIKEKMLVEAFEVLQFPSGEKFEKNYYSDTIHMGENIKVRERWTVENFQRFLIKFFREYETSWSNI